MQGNSVKQVFMSHAIKDADFAHRLADDLKRLGARVWIAPESILPGESWVDAIERGLGESSHVVFVLTPAALEASGVKMERDMAITLALRDRIKVISLQLKPCEVPLVLSRYQMILAFQKDYEAGLSQLAGHLGLRVEPSEPEEKKKPERIGSWPRLRLPLAVVGLMAIVLLVGAVAFWLGSSDGKLSRASTATEPVVVPLITETPTATATSQLPPPTPADTPETLLETRAPGSTAIGTPTSQDSTVTQASVPMQTRTPVPSTSTRTPTKTRVAPTSTQQAAIGDTQTSQPTKTPTSTPTAVPTSTATRTSTKTSTPRPTRTPTRTPTPALTLRGRLVFHRNPGSYELSDNEIYTYDIQRGITTRLTENTFSDWIPRWSPDGTQIAFTSNRDNDIPENFDVWVMDAAGSNPRRAIATGAWDEYAAWSPLNNGQIAFSTTADNNSEIHVGTSAVDLRRLTFNNVRDEWPTWSPDGARIAHSNYQFGKGDIFVTDVSTGATEWLYGSEGDDNQPAWSPDGRWIVFVQRTNDKDAFGKLVLMAADGSSPSTLTQADATNPAWSPDSEWIVFARGLDSNGNDELDEKDETDLWAVERASGTLIPLVKAPGADLAPSWTY